MTSVASLLTRIVLTLVKLFIMLVVTAMFLFQFPELRYDFGPKEPVSITAPDALSVEKYPVATFAAVEGTPDFSRAAVFAKHGVRFTYFLLEEYGEKLVVRTPEEMDEQWTRITRHVGRLRPYARMPFRRSVRAGFRQQFDVGIPEDALFLGRDDVPRVSGWSVGALCLASLLWGVLFYFFFLWKKRAPAPA